MLGVWAGGVSADHQQWRGQVAHGVAKNHPWKVPSLSSPHQQRSPTTLNPLAKGGERFPSVLFSIRHPSGVSNILPPFHYPLKPGNNKHAKVFGAHCC